MSRRKRRSRSRTIDRESLRTAQTWFTALIGIATIAIFWPALSCDFVNYHDPGFVTGNPQVQAGLSRENLAAAFSKPLMGNWHPLTTLSHMLDSQLFGLRPRWHHLTSVLLHTANAMLLFSLLCGMTGALWRSALVAALFAWHPLSVEPVAWVAERKEVLSALFGLLALSFYARYVRALNRKAVESGSKADGSAIRRLSGPTFNYALALFCFALGLMSKPTVVTLPFVMLLLDWWPLNRFTASPLQHLNPNTAIVRRLLLEKLPFFALSLVSTGITIWARGQVRPESLHTDLSLPLRLENALVAWVRYLGKLAWPTNLAVFYPQPDRWQWWLVFFSAVLLVGVCVGVLRLARRSPFLVTGWFWFLVTLMPVLGLVLASGPSIADRHTYLPAVGIFIVFAWGLVVVSGRWLLTKTAAFLVTLVLLVTCVDRTLVQLRYWRNSETLFRRALAVTRNNHVAHHNLGAALLAEGRVDEAIRQFHAALEIVPEDVRVLNDLGVALLNKGSTDEAVGRFREALKIRPNDPEILSNLGAALTRKRQFEEAIANCELAVKLKPDYPEGYVNLGNALAQAGRLEEAGRQFRRALELKPDHYAAHNGLGNVLLAQRKVDEAIGHFMAALRARPEEPATREYLGNALVAQGRLDDAIAHYTTGLRLAPDRLSLHRALGEAWMANGDWERARTHFAAVVEARPESPIARYQLGRALAASGDKQGALVQLRQAVRLDPDVVGFLNNLAWMLATDPDERVRNGIEAVELSERAAKLTGFTNVAVLDTLAAAYAECGRMDEAVSIAEKALDLAGSGNTAKLAPAIRVRLEKYRSGRPHRE